MDEKGGRDISVDGHGGRGRRRMRSFGLRAIRLVRSRPPARPAGPASDRRRLGADDARHLSGGGRARRPLARRHQGLRQKIPPVRVGRGSGPDRRKPWERDEGRGRGAAGAGRGGDQRADRDHRARASRRRRTAADPGRLPGTEGRGDDPLRAVARGSRLGLVARRLEERALGEFRLRHAGDPRRAGRRSARLRSGAAARPLRRRDADESHRGRAQRSGSGHELEDGSRSDRRQRIEQPPVESPQSAQ